MRGLCGASCFYFSLESVLMGFQHYHLASLLAQHTLYTLFYMECVLLTFHMYLHQVSPSSSIDFLDWMILRGAVGNCLGV